MNQQLQRDATGIVMAVLVSMLIAATTIIFWQAQVIAKQNAVIHMQGGGQ